MKKKVLSMMLAGAMTVSMLAGCGAGSDEAATTDNTAADKDRDSRNNRSRRGYCRSIRKSGDIKNCVDVRRNRSE